MAGNMGLRRGWNIKCGYVDLLCDGVSGGAAA
jgi:hypothetical protein